jgi:hypothetical protein
MNSEWRQHIGRKDNQYYFALEILPSHDDGFWLHGAALFTRLSKRKRNVTKRV